MLNPSIQLGYNRTSGGKRRRRRNRQARHGRTDGGGRFKKRKWTKYLAHLFFLVSKRIRNTQILFALPPAARWGEKLMYTNPRWLYLVPPTEENEHRGVNRKKKLFCEGKVSTEDGPNGKPLHNATFPPKKSFPNMINHLGAINYAAFSPKCARVVMS